MSDETGPGVPASRNPTGRNPTGPQPEPLRFFGTTWVRHDGGYVARRVGIAVGALAAAVVACLVLRFAFEGLQIAAVGGLVNLLVVVMFAVCSAIAFRRTWQGFRERADPEMQARLRSLMAIGFVGSLLAYCVRSLTEAPGEGLLRTEYEEARERYERRSVRRTGNPAKSRSNASKNSSSKSNSVKSSSPKSTPANKRRR